MHNHAKPIRSFIGSANCSTPENPLYIRCPQVWNRPLFPSTLYSRVNSPEPSQDIYKYLLSPEDIVRDKTDYGLIFTPAEKVKQVSVNPLV